MIPTYRTDSGVAVLHPKPKETKQVIVDLNKRVCITMITGESATPTNPTDDDIDLAIRILQDKYYNEC